MKQAGGILFTAFEPSGDEHAAPVIAHLRQARPDIPIWALGGPKMAQAGASLIENTTDQPVMLAGAVRQAWAHRQRLKRLRNWLRDQHLTALVPVDSPAANWSICGLIRRSQPDAKIIHLVAPQLWAWASWRIKKMRRLSDHVLCLLPFEEDWFRSRGVDATFVGHPVLNPADAHTATTVHLSNPPPGCVKIALLPGSRAGEIRANWPTMIKVLRRIQERHDGVFAIAAAPNERIAALIRAHIEQSDGASDRLTGLEVRVGETDAVIRWSDVALAVSGTVTLHVAVHRRPMVVFYNLNWWAYQLVGRWLVKARTFALPNVIGEAAGMGRIVPEFVPHYGQIAPLVAELDRLITNQSDRKKQIADLEAMMSHFAGRSYPKEAAQQILKIIGNG